MGEWKEMTLGDLVTFQRGHDLSQDQFQDGQYPIVSSFGVIGYHSQYTTPRNGVTIGRSGNSIGKPFFVESDFWAHNTTLYVKEFHNSFPKFVFYLLKTINFKAFDSGSAVPSLNRNYIHPLSIKAPDYEEQKQVANILSCLDRKISNLRKQNETLERIAQTLFKHWFVDFEFLNEDGKPYKSSGGEMVRSELGEIPVGWHVGNLGGMGKIICGKTPSKKQPDFYDGDIPFIKIPDMHNRVFVESTSEYLSVKGGKSQPKKIIPAYSVNVSCIATVGLVTINTKPSHTNQQINSIVLNQEEYLEFLFFHCKGLSETLRSIGSGGTATLNVNTGIFSRLTLVIPPSDVIAVFHGLSKSVFRKIEVNSSHIQTLAKTRDVLLPKLMSGKLRITAP